MKIEEGTLVKLPNQEIGYVEMTDEACNEVVVNRTIYSVNEIEII